jgi:parvulin-like peptidyl-prolyl isomerase
MPWSVNGELVPDQAIREEARNIRPQLQQAMEGEDAAVVEARVKEWSRENVIERLLLRQAAAADPEPVDAEEVKAAFERIKAEAPGETGVVALGSDESIQREIELRLRIDRLMARASAKTSAPAMKDIAEHYRKNREEYRTPETIRARHIVKNIDANCDEATARLAIDEAKAKLASGADFARLADEASDCPGRGGELGYFPPGQMVEEFDEVVFALATGQTSDVFRTGFGFHIAQVLDRRPAGVRSLEEMKPEISEQLHEQKRQKAVEAFLDSLWKKAKIEEVPA